MVLEAGKRVGGYAETAPDCHMHQELELFVINVFEVSVVEVKLAVVAPDEGAQASMLVGGPATEELALVVGAGMEVETATAEDVLE